jgi:hypothetical protein
MALFLIIAEDDSTPRDIQGIVDSAFPNAYRINKQCWIISHKGLTTEKIARQLNLPTEDQDDSEGTQGVVVIRATPSYWGSANTKLWDWLAAQIEKPNG